MAEGLTGSSLRSPQRALGTESGRMFREARRLERKGYSGAAQQVALGAAQQKLNERPGFLSADTAIAEQRLRQQAGMQGAALASGMRPQDSRRGLFEDIRAASGATTMPAVATAPAGPVISPTPAPLQGPALPEPVGRIGSEPASEVLRAMRAPTAGTPTRSEATGATGDMSDFLRGVSALTSPEGGDLTRGDAVDELNRQRMAAGLPALPREEALQGLLAQDRSASRQRTAEFSGSRQRTQGLLSTPQGTPDPNLVSGFRNPVAVAPAPAAPTTPAAPAAPAARTLDDMLRERQAYVADYPNRPSSFEGSRAQQALAPVAESTRAALAAARESARKQAADAARSLRQATRGTAFEQSRIGKLLGGQ